MNKKNSNNYRVLSWYGSATGVDLTAQFDINHIKGKKITIKRIAFFPYSNDALVTRTWKENGVNVSNEEIPPASRITDLQGLEIYGKGLKPQIKINNISLALFPLKADNTFFGYPIDLDVDNINVKFDSAVQSITVSAAFEIYNQAVNTFPPTDNDTLATRLKVIMEVYLD